MSEKKSADERKVLDKIAGWPAEQRAIGERLHELVLAAVPGLKAKLFYGAPGYTTGGPVLVFFRCDDGIMSFGISEKADISVPQGAADQLVESAWFVAGLDEATEQRITAVVQRAVPS